MKTPRPKSKEKAGFQKDPHALRVKKIVHAMKNEFQSFGPVWDDDAEGYFVEKFTASVDKTLKDESPGDDLWERDQDSVLNLLLATGLICNARYEIAGKLALLSKQDLIHVLEHVREASCGAANVMGRWCTFLEGKSKTGKNKKGRVARKRKQVRSKKSSSR